MRLIRGLTNLKSLSQQDEAPLANGCVATIGNFDGVHLGHQTIIDQVHEKALELGVPSVVMVFEPQPREFFQGRDAPPRLMPFRQKFELLLASGIDVVLCLRFNERFRSYSGMGFIEDVLIDGLGVRHLVVGDDFRFGCDRAGDFSLLREVGVQRGFTVENTRTVTVHGERVSSTRIRGVLSENRINDAEDLLGHPYRIRGRIVYGRQLGRQIGAPTANILLPHMPALKGVYVVSATLEDGRVLDGVANIGLRPTVDGKQPSLEVHLFDFAGTLYGQRLDVVFRHALRDEVKFDSVDDLKEQIARDFDDARAWIAGHGSSATER
ncbi:MULTISPECIES: bifunctional riboflavin kinase/FAD synthetase [Marinobacter]|jgi:riboflavin kinase/FMN adenylyltransferase|uniref:Riboflavin biosynthesis protein n=1 Tax=Marinobacter salarius TaxID=1420917 RepID=A0ABY1FRB5_9GAMM|nr:MULTISPECIES: bifunctional riboflavin kinase/FAD synthetase [Marinobacter]KXJ46425.1 MAG: bifunctional riboflavin kinase/FMN adenylyltransferase [Marinobacter sp. Hex_13]MBS8232228.1 bifunctional riboflavin kinase/FAD synthetase [Marinobacter salarius]MDP4534139.1 bifunctional riboflavin kinase/FAD synthetase [Marinobacter salarius]SFL91511.1 riboflavin kinase / FMN adenylyltransferase [Marinobacter salarius]